MRLTCDDCGSVQSGKNDKCELCGGSLFEERDRAVNGSPIGLLLASIATTVVLFALPGWLIHWYWLDHVPTSSFWGWYLGAWVVGSVLVQWYTPRESYDFGWRAGPYYIEKPFSTDREHAFLGLLLFPMGLVSGLWVATFKRLIPR